MSKSTVALLLRNNHILTDSYPIVKADFHIFIKKYSFVV